jgi:hypothetical protein
MLFYVNRIKVIWVIPVKTRKIDLNFLYGKFAIFLIIEWLKLIKQLLLLLNIINTEL